MESIWLQSEGDNWFSRNKERLGKHSDIPLLLLQPYSIRPETVIEIGASNGYRLAKIHEQYNSSVTAVEPSSKAVEDGKEKYPFITFVRNTCEDADVQGKFDLVIVNFVLHWIGRDSLFKCVQKVDEVLKDDGHLILGDFGTEHFFKRKYHHLKDAGLYTWKAPYWEQFTKSGRYLEIAKLRFNHDTREITSSINNDNMGTAVLLKKTDMYCEV